MCKDKIDHISLKTPCKECPFRSDKAFIPLGQNRIEGIVNHIRQDGYFPCHKSTTHEEQEDGQEMILQDKSFWCAGALAMLEKQGETNNHRAPI